MVDRFGHHGAAVVAVVAFGIVAIVGTTSLGLVAAGAMMVSSILDRRSLAWALIVAALLLVGPVMVVLGAVALTPSRTERDLKIQAVAALRCSVAACFSPTLVVGSALGAYRGGGKDRDMWWLIGWMPGTLTAVVAFVLWHSLVTLALTVTVAFAGAFLSLDRAWKVSETAAIPDPLTPGALAAVGRGSEIVRPEAEVDWSRVVEAPEAISGRPAKAPTPVPDDAASLQPPNHGQPDVPESEVDRSETTP